MSTFANYSIKHKVQLMGTWSNGHGHSSWARAKNVRCKDILPFYVLYHWAEYLWVWTFNGAELSH